MFILSHWKRSKYWCLIFNAYLLSIFITDCQILICFYISGAVDKVISILKMFYLLSKFCNNSRNKTPTTHNTNISLIKYIHFLTFRSSIVYTNTWWCIILHCSFCTCYLQNIVSCFPLVFITITLYLRFSWSKISAFFRGGAIWVWEPIGCYKLGWLDCLSWVRPTPIYPAAFLTSLHPNTTYKDQRDCCCSTCFW